MPPSGPPLRHRGDIDGLRAIAILSVLLVHCGVTALRGGFIGVDVFFVISGYLITLISEREIAAGRFTVAAFYRRRALRILPALAAMVAVVLVMGCLVLFPHRLRDLGMSAAATAVFASNIYFRHTSDYFAQAADAMPLVHTWSLAVEEQFYLLYPLLLIALRRASPARKRMVIGVLGVLSLALGAWQGVHSAVAGFFLLPARVWELGLGALVALGTFPAVSARMAGWLALAGLLLIAGSVVVVSPSWPFPVPWAIPPVLGAALLIAYGEGAPTARLLSWRPARAVGLISYSLYLWHRPIIAFWMLAHGTTLKPGDTVVLIALSLAAACVSYFAIERPFLAMRRQPAGAGRWRVHIVSLCGIAVAAAAGLAVAWAAPVIRPLPPAVAQVAAFEGWDKTPGAEAQYSAHCFLLPHRREYDPAACLALAHDRPNLLLLGDSFAAQLSQAMHDAFPTAHIVQVTAAGCRPLIGGEAGPAGCRAMSDIVFSGKVDLRAIDRVILGGRWLPGEPPALMRTIAFFRARGIPVTVIGPMVEYDVDEPTALASAMLDGDPHRIDRLRLMDRGAMDAELAPQVRAAGAIYVSAWAQECPGGACRLTAANGDPLHIDHSHLTPAGAAEFVAAYRAVLGPVSPIAASNPASHAPLR